MPVRSTRDQLIITALNMAQLPNLDIHDIPDRVVQPDAFSIQWLQDVLDFWFHMVPFSATLTDVTLACVAHQDLVVLPQDFIIDMRNGYRVQRVVDDAGSYVRAIRLPSQKFLSAQLQSQRFTGVMFPTYYCIEGVSADGRQLMKLAPTPEIATLGILKYYQLPPVLEAGDRPTFPSDYVCVEYIRLRALEWAGIIDPGTAQKFCTKVVMDMKANGLLNNPENDEIPMDEIQFPGYSMGHSGVIGHTSWMGPQ